MWDKTVRFGTKPGQMALCAALGVLALLASLQAAQAQRVEVSLYDRTLGRELELHAHHDGRTYAAGEAGHRYAIVLRNRSGARVLAVVAVDGINVVSGETAHPRQTGYVLDPWQSLTINGWRKSLDEVAAFHFAPLPESYAARSGRPLDVGVIGVAVFDEAAPPQAWLSEPSRQPPAASPPFGSDAPRSSKERARAAADEGLSDTHPPAESRSPSMQPLREQRLGTAHGERERDQARRTAFRRATVDPVETRTLWYDTRRNLLAAGILPSPIHPPWTRPRPFPGFVPDPG